MKYFCGRQRIYTLYPSWKGKKNFFLWFVFLNILPCSSEVKNGNHRKQKDVWKSYYEYAYIVIHFHWSVRVLYNFTWWRFVYGMFSQGSALPYWLFWGIWCFRHRCSFSRALASFPRTHSIRNAFFMYNGWLRRWLCVRMYTPFGSLC